MDADDLTQRVCAIASLPHAERVERIRELRNLKPTAAAEILDALLNVSLDANSTAAAIKLLGVVGSAKNLETLLRHFETSRPAVAKALVAIGVFDEVMPNDSRQRQMFSRALSFAKPELADLIREGNITTETIRALLPPMM